MSCDYFGEKISKGEDFVTIGKYPASWKALLSRGTLAEDSGKLNQDLLCGMLKKENAEP